MRKFTQAMLVLLAFLGSTIGAVAQNNYPVNVSTTDTRSPINSNRNYSGITLQPERGTIQTITIGDKVYCDMTSSGESGTFKIKAGASAYPRFVIKTNGWDGSWMHSFIFVDSDNNGQFQVNGLDNDDELYAHFGIKKGQNNSNVPMINSTQSFRVPQTPGTYRMRYLVAWETNTSSPNPAGNNRDGSGNTLNANGGVIVDVNLQVEYPTITTVVSGAEAEVTYSGNPICGQDFTFTAPDKFGFTKTVTVKCGENFDDAQATSTVSYYNNSSSETPVNCYNWEQVTPTDNGDGTYTVPADKMKGDLQITVTYTKDVMTLIKAGKQVFRLKNREYTTSPYLKVAKSDVKSNVRPYDVGDAILYHVNATMANEAGASCLWRLMPVSGSSGPYYLRSQNANASDLHSGEDYPIKMTENGSELYLVESGSYYGLGTSSSTSDKVFLHAVAYGMSNSDGNGKYVDTSNGDYVTTWNLSESASQWTFEAVDEIGITIGTSGYASVNYDFPVKFPAGVKVYKKAEEAATYIRLAEITPGADGCVSLPTGNAAFVAGTPGASIMLEILLDEPAAIDGGTGVSGTYLATTFDANSAANVYGIAKVNDVVAFYKMQGGTTIKQNKGYIESATNNAPRMELTFGEGETTGIESMLEDNSRRESIDTSVLYDLNGRRVLYPSRGIYVTAGGQRIFLK